MSEKLSIVELIKAQLAGDTRNIPVFHALAARLQQVMARPDFSITEVNRLISADAGLSSQVLRVSNSPFYAGLSPVNTIQEAIVRLGAREVSSIVMLATQHDLYRSHDPKFNQAMKSLWEHSYCCAVASKWLAAKAGFGFLAQEAFMSGLLHDIGKLFLLKVMEDIFKDNTLGVGASPAILNEVLYNMHADQGRLLMEQWHMPTIYSEVVAHHEDEKWDHGNPLLTIVRLANLACRKLGIGMRADASLVLFASAESQELGLKEIVLAELEIVVEDALKQPLSC